MKNNRSWGSRLFCKNVSNPFRVVTYRRRGSALLFASNVVIHGFCSKTLFTQQVFLFLLLIPEIVIISTHISVFLTKKACNFVLWSSKHECFDPVFHCDDIIKK